MVTLPVLSLGVVVALRKLNVGKIHFMYNYESITDLKICRAIVGYG